MQYSVCGTFFWHECPTPTHSSADNSLGQLADMHISEWDFGASCVETRVQCFPACQSFPTLRNPSLQIQPSYTLEGHFYLQGPEFHLIHLKVPIMLTIWASKASFLYVKLSLNKLIKLYLYV